VIGGKTLGDAVAGIMSFLLNVSVQWRYTRTDERKEKVEELKAGCCHLQ